ncbi:putative quinol monooxygenase [Agromyces aurantiacus]|uniref:Quinol monooxygenase n=1 Tax=Agromyces aurantiacus TaxID=165814 RepID=A0ABV9R9R6_9MICO|nr:putative quinol monooxygenase [Agromyces aurantiacus]MBM7503582.1 quinol monooxygenase YgiN [Agromyces aurantiacus]
MTYVCTVRWVARDGEAATVRELLRELVAASRAEPGNLSYRAAESIDAPGTFRLFEAYVDEASFQAHAASEHFARLALHGAVPLLAHREREFGIAIEP